MLPATRAATLLALAALLAPTFGVAAQGEGPAFTLGGRTEGGDLVVQVGAASEASVQLVVTHYSSAWGTMVDRVVPLNIPAGRAVDVRLKDLPVDTGFEARIVEARHALPTYPGAARLIDGNRMPEVPTLARVFVGSVPASHGVERTVTAYPVASSERVVESQVIATRAGLVVTTYPRAVDGVLMARVSADGGHGFGASFAVSAPNAMGGWRWSLTEDVQGDVIVLYHSYTREEHPPRMARIDPRAQRVVADVALASGTPGVEFTMPPTAYTAVPLTGGSFLVATYNRLVTAEGGRVFVNEPSLWSLSREGVMTFQRSIVPEQAENFRMAGNVIAALGAAWTVDDGAELRYTHSFSTGAAFEPVRSITAASLGYARLRGPLSIGIDDTGAVLATFAGEAIPHTGGTAFLVRARYGEPPTVQRAADLAGVGGAYAAHVAVDRMRVALAWPGDSGFHTAVSDDGGVTFTAPDPRWWVKPDSTTRYQPNANLGQYVALLPDKRPLLFATAGEHLVSVPMYDPVPDAGDPNTIVRLLDASPPATPPTPAPTPAPNPPPDASPSPTPSPTPTPVEAGDEAAVAVDARVEIASVEPALLRVTPGATTSARVTLRNNGGARADGIAVDALGFPPGVRAHLSPGAASIAAGGVRAYDMTITTDAGTPGDPGAVSSATLIARTPNGDVLATHKVVWAYAPLSVLDVQPRLIAISPGETVTVEVTIVNRGVLPVDNALLSFPQLPQGIQASTGGFSVDDGASATVAITLHMPADTGHWLDGESARLAFDVLLDGAFVGEGEATVLLLPAAVPIEVSEAPISPPGPDARRGWGAAMAAGLVGVAGAVVALRTDRARHGFWALVAPLYSRLSPGQALRHEIRAAVHAHVRDHPGIRYEDLRRALRLSNGSLAFHLRVLEREGYVTSRAEWTRRRFYVTGAAPQQGATATAAEEIVALLAREPALGPADVAARIGISRQLARYHLARLERSGRVSSGRDDGRLVYRTGPK